MAVVNRDIGRATHADRTRDDGVDSRVCEGGRAKNNKKTGTIAPDSRFWQSSSKGTVFVPDNNIINHD
jgi:hypothetical protein